MKLGVAAGSIAAGVHSAIGSVAAGSAFALAQSAGAVGVSAATANIVGSGTLAATGGAVAALYRWLRPRPPNDMAGSNFVVHWERSDQDDQAITLHTPVTEITEINDSFSEGELNQEQRRRQVKAAILPNGLTIHIFQLDGQLFSSGIEIALILPRCQGEKQLMEILIEKSININLQIITPMTASTVFDDCIAVGVPWIKNEGVLIDVITLYPLANILPLLFKLGVTDTAIILALQREMRNYDA